MIKIEKNGTGEFIAFRDGKYVGRITRDISTGEWSLVIKYEKCESRSTMPSYRDARAELRIAAER
jgi:hypothetical protein